MLEGLEHIEVLPDEVIDGVSCVHYRGSYDPFHLDALREQIENETDPDLKEMLQHILEVQEQLKEEMEMTAVAEVWIGKDDYLVRQKCVTQSWKMTDDEDINGTLFPVGTKVTFTGILKFSNFNEPVKIEVPL